MASSLKKPEDFTILGSMSYNEKIIEADKQGVSPFDIDEKIKTEVVHIIDALHNQTKMRKVFILLEYAIVTIVLSTIALFVSLFDSQGRGTTQNGRILARIHLMASGIRVSVTGLEKTLHHLRIYSCVITRVPLIFSRFSWHFPFSSNG